MAPVAGHLSRGVPPTQFGPQVTGYVQLDWPRPSSKSGPSVEWSWPLIHSAI